MKDIVTAQIAQIRLANKARSAQMARLYALPRTRTALQQLIDESIMILRTAALEGIDRVSTLEKQYKIS